MGKYDDIINLPHHVSKKHPQMPIADRAAQFAPFAALTGYGEQIKETARTTEEFHQVSGREKEEIDQKLQILLQTQYKHPLISTYYFTPDARKQGGHYEKKTEYVKRIDPVKEYIIPFQFPADLIHQKLIVKRLKKKIASAIKYLFIISNLFVRTKRNQDYLSFFFTFIFFSSQRNFIFCSGNDIISGWTIFQKQLV